MNVENATSDDSMKIDEDLVAALGFEPASDILIVDDALNDDLSISSDDIQVSTKESLAEAPKPPESASAKADTRPPGRKSNKQKGKNKATTQTPPVSSKKSSLIDRLDADSKNADSKSSAPKTEAKREASADPRPAESKSTTAGNGSKSAVADTDHKTDSNRNGKDSAKTGQESDNPGFSVVPPPPVAANAVLLSEPSPATYGFSDVKLPDFKGAFARFTRSDTTTSDAEASVTANVEQLTAEVSAVTQSKDVAAKAAPSADAALDSQVVQSPPKVGMPPVVDGPVTSPPQIAPQPEIQIVETPAEPNVYRAPTRTGRTRIRSRKVRRQIRHIDPWSVLTFSVIFHACVFGALLLASVLVWRFADGAGLIENAESFWAALADKPDFEIDQGVLIRSAAMIAGLLAIASSVMMVLLTVFFNLISDIVGGIRVTVIEEEPVRITK